MKEKKQALEKSLHELINKINQYKNAISDAEREGMEIVGKIKMLDELMKEANDLEGDKK